MDLLGPDVRIFAGSYYDKTQLDVLDHLVSKLKACQFLLPLRLSITSGLQKGKAIVRLVL